MIIVFEGHDKSGKSTIAKALASCFDCKYLRDEFLKQAASEDANQSYARYQLALFADCFDPDKYVIIDRALLSHLVYSNVFGQAHSDNVIDKTIELLKDKVFYVICYKTGKLDEDDLFPYQEKIRDEFFKLAKQFEDCSFLLDTTDQDLNTQLDKIYLAIMAYQKQYRHRAGEWKDEGIQYPECSLD